METLFTPDQVAARLHLSRLTVIEYLRRGALRGVKLTKTWLVREQDLEAFINQRVVDGDAPEQLRILPGQDIRQAPFARPAPRRRTTPTHEPSRDPEAAVESYPDPMARKGALLARLRARKAQGRSLQAMADELNAEAVPTLSGRGLWKKGTIGNLLAEGGHR